MKRILLLILLTGALGAQANDIPAPVELSPLPLLPGTGFNPDLVPIREVPGPNAEIIEVEIHSRTVPLTVTKYKETTLGYGNVTGKILVPDLAAVALLNHRNDGEEAPCLAGPRDGMNHPVPIDNALLPEDVPVKVSLINHFRIDRERKICQLHLIEVVEAEVQGVLFTHRLVRDNDFRYIGDCPAE